VPSIEKLEESMIVLRETIRNAPHARHCRYIWPSLRGDRTPLGSCDCWQLTALTIIAQSLGEYHE